MDERLVVCEACGAVLADSQKHTEWHQNAARGIVRAVGEYERNAGPPWRQAHG